jgi:hypothetical protein
MLPRLFSVPFVNLVYVPSCSLACSPDFLLALVKANRDF